MAVDAGGSRKRAVALENLSDAGLRLKGINVLGIILLAVSL